MKKIRTQVDRFVGKLLVLILGIMVINVLWQVEFEGMGNIAVISL